MDGVDGVDAWGSKSGANEGESEEDLGEEHCGGSIGVVVVGRGYG